MKKSKVKKILVIVMAITLLCSFTVNAAPRINPLWDYLIAISASIDISDNNIAYIEVDADADGIDVDKMKATCSLQKLDGSWKTIKTWTETESGRTILYDKTYGVYSGYSYRLKVTVSAYKGNKLLESATEYFDYGYYG